MKGYIVMLVIFTTWARHEENDMDLQDAGLPSKLHEYLSWQSTKKR